MRVAIVHDWLIRLGGAERVLIAFHKIFPEASIFTLFYDKEFILHYLPKAKITSSFLQKIPNIKKLHPWLKILMPVAAESLDLSDFDLVISSSHEVSHGVLVRQTAKHICFYHSPSRILWDRSHDYVKDFEERDKGIAKIFLIKLGQHFLRLWDWQAGRRPDIAIANSNHVAERIKKYYGREAKVVYPPVEILLGRVGISGERIRRPFWLGPSTILLQNGAGQNGRRPRRLPLEQPRMSEPDIPTRPIQTDNYFLIVSQLYPHKNLDLAIKAFKLLNLNLLIIGEGPEKKRLKRLIGQSANIRLLGFVPDEELPFYYKNCLGYLICNEEDFGISPIEAMSFGKPVLAYKKGGATETIIEEETGEFFNKLEVDDLSRAVELFNEKIKSGHFSLAAIKKHSEKFGFETFKKEILKVVKDLGYNLN